jgi:hypothetical protein
METKTKINLSLKIPLDLNERIIAEAEKEKRSRHSQIIYSLEKLFAKNGKTRTEKGFEKEKTK